MLGRIASVIFIVCNFLSLSAVAQENLVGEPAGRQLSPKLPSLNEICRTIEAAAGENELPADFFFRLIWQESRFNTRAVSRAGARGIAQFMPKTAIWRGLADPFEVAEALREAASYLRELRKQFGNLGLAAAAYNGGSGRVQNWLNGRGGLPSETRAYVRIVTGHTAEEWASPEPPETGSPKAIIPCPQIANLVTSGPARSARARSQTVSEPWGVQLLGDRSENAALAEYAQLQRKYPAVLAARAPLVLRTRIRAQVVWVQIRVGSPSRQDAEKLCSGLRAAGGTCVVLRHVRQLASN
jgi:hypothetical protein